MSDTRLIRKLEPTRVAAPIYDNLAFAFCEIDEQTGSANETNRPLLGPQESGSLNSFTAAIYKIERSF
jgi:hypothetical protein